MPFVYDRTVRGFDALHLRSGTRQGYGWQIRELLPVVLPVLLPHFVGAANTQCLARNTNKAIKKPLETRGFFMARGKGPSISVAAAFILKDTPPLIEHYC